MVIGVSGDYCIIYKGFSTLNLFHSVKALPHRPFVNFHTILSKSE